MAATSAPPSLAHRIRLRPATVADRAEMAQIYYDTFGRYAMMRRLAPNGPSPEVLATFAASLIPNGPEEEAMVANGKPKGGECIIMIAELLPEEAAPPVPGAKPELVGFAKWTIYRKPRTEEEWNVPLQDVPQEFLDKSIDAQVWNEFMVDLDRRAQRLIKGDPAMHLDSLVCTIKYHRLGAGTALLKAGLAVADAADVPAFLESSPAGYKLYRRYGFEDVEAQDLPLTEKWGIVQAEGDNWGQNDGLEVCGPLNDGHFRTTIVRRPAKSENAA